MYALKNFGVKLTHLRSMDARSNGAYIDYVTFGSDDERCECLRHADHAPDIDIIHALCRVYVEIQGWRYDRLTGIIH